MKNTDSSSFTRRQVLKYGVAGIYGAVTSPVFSLADNANRAVELAAKKGLASILSGTTTRTEVWAYNDLIPGPVLRLRQGQRIQVVAENKLHQRVSED